MVAVLIAIIKSGCLAIIDNGLASPVVDISLISGSLKNIIIRAAKPINNDNKRNDPA